MNVFKGDEVEQALEEVVMQRQFTVQVSEGDSLALRPLTAILSLHLSPL